MDNVNSKIVKKSGRQAIYIHIDPFTKSEFKAECARNLESMNKVLTTLMQSYVITSRDMHANKEHFNPSAE